MAIAFDANTTVQTAISITLTYNHTVGAGADRILFVLVWTGSGSVTTGVTYNGVAMTKIADKAAAGATEMSLWRLTNPASGSHDVVVTNNGGGAARSTSYSSSYSGVAQTNPIDAFAVAGPTTTTSYSQSLTTTADNCWAIMMGYAQDVANKTAGANTVLRYQDKTVVGSFLADTGAAKTPPGTDTMTITSTSQTFESIMASFKPPGTAYDSILTETISFADILSKSSVRALIESFSIADTLAAGKIMVQTFTESFGLNDLIKKLVNGFTYWANKAKNISSYNNRNKNISTYNNRDKNDSDWINRDKL